MDFPHVLAEVKQRISDSMARKPLNITCLCSWLVISESLSPSDLENRKKAANIQR